MQPPVSQIYYAHLCSYQHKITVHTIDYTPLEERFEEILGEIKLQSWYTHNPKLQEYIQNECLNCPPVSTELCATVVLFLPDFPRH